MTFEVRDLVWLLLLLVALVWGWYAGRRDQRARTRDGGLSADYFRGINYLLNEQPDKAIEVFTRMLEVNTDTVETHLALGGLFRRRGEVERAIRIHQNLIARPSLDRAQRSQALCELALDYQKAGLLDRAEVLFLELAEIPAHAEQALRSLMHIYEQEKDWDQAMAAGRRLMQATGRSLAPILAQYRCEQAEHALKEGRLADVRGAINDALALDPRCARANLIAGRAARVEGRLGDAIAAWTKIEQQAPAMLDEAVDELAAAYRQLGDEAGLYAYLRDVAGRRPGMRVLQRLTELIRARDGVAAAHAFLAERLRQSPSVPGLKEFVDLQLAQDDPATRGDLAVLKAVLDRLVRDQQGYQCRQCGFRGQALHWQCPACHEWLTLQPVSCDAGLGGAAAEDAPLTPNNKRNRT